MFPLLLILAFLTPIVESIGHCQIDPSSYLVFFSEDSEGPFWFHGLTTDTSYIHVGAVQYAPEMFYHVYAVDNVPGLLAMLPNWNPDNQVIEEAVLRLLRLTNAVEQANLR